MKKLLLSGFALLSVWATAQYSWTPQNSGFTATSTGVSKVIPVSPTVAWAYGYDGTSANQNYQVFTKTTNGGATWTPGSINIGNTALQISDMTAVDANNAWVATNTGTNDGVYRTSDGGATWVRQATATYSDANSFPNVVHFFDVNNGVTQGDPIGGEFEIYTTTDGGTTWVKVPGANIPNPLAGEYGYTTKGEAAGNVYWFGTNKGRLYMSSDRGLNWTVSQTPLPDFGSAASNGDMAVKDAQNGWVIDQDGILYATTNAGGTWDPVPFVGTVFGSDIVYVPGTANTLVSSGANPNSTNGIGSSISTDGGLNWTTIDDTAQYLSLGAYDASTVYAGGFSGTGGGMYKLSPLAATVNPALASNKIVVYPNPTKGDVNIKAKSTVTTVEVVDLSGRVVKTFGSITQLDLSGLKAGVYMLNVTLADGSKNSTKLIKN